MKRKIAHIRARARAWAEAHLCGGLPRFARVKAWALARRGNITAAADIWRRLAQNTTRPTAAAICWTRQGRYLLYSGRMAEAETAFNRALEARPGYAPALVSLAQIALRREHWIAAAQHAQALLSAEIAPAGRLEALQILGVALIHQGRFAEAGEIIDRLAQNEHGRRAALELRVAMATTRLDADGLRAAWDELRARFPDAAAPPAWLCPDEREDEPAAAPRYTAQDLKKAKGAEKARRILAQVGRRLPTTARLDLLAETAARFPHDAELQIRYIQSLLWDFSNAREFQAAQTRVREFCARFPGYAQAPQLALKAAIAANDIDAAAGALQAWQKKQGGHGAMDLLQVWLAAKRGEQTQARALDRQLREQRYTLALDNRGLDLAPLNAAPRQAFTDKILLFTALRNEMLFLPWFLDYYRALGVDWFFIVDNGSNDGTVERLTAQKDVTVYASTDNFAATVSGMQWMNELIRRHGQGNWCVYVDADEQLVAPGIETRGLRGVVDDMTARGEEVMPAYMLDTYPPDMVALRDFKPGDNPLTVSSLLDPDYFFSGKALCCFFAARGGARDRLFDIRDKIEKAPILRGGVGLYLDNHNTTYARVSRECGALLHHKILREALEAQKPQHNEWRMAHRLAGRQQMHMRYRESGLLDLGKQLPRGPNAVTYTDSDQLVRLGLIGEFATLRGGRGAAA